MSKPLNIPLNLLRGKWSSGDPTLVPDGYCQQCRNVVVRPNRLETRPPLVYDNLMNIRGIAAFEDQANKVVRLMAVDSSQAIYEKATSGDTWSASKGTVSGTRLTDHTNYRGKMYGMMDNGSGLPTAAFSFDGTTLTSTPFNSAIQGRTVTSYLDRIFIAYPRVTVTNGLSLANSYDPTGWTLSNVVVENLTSSGVTIGRLTMTSLTSAYADISAGSTVGGLPFDAVWRCDLRNTHPTYAVPLSLKVVPAARINLHAYVLGALILPATSTGFRYRCVVAGTTAAAPPVFGTALGGDTVDGTVTWRCDGPEAIGSSEVTLPPRTSNTWSTFYIDHHIDVPLSSLFLFRIAFGNANAAVTTMVSVEVSLKDGTADGSVGKQNYGQQWTTGVFRYPFFNLEGGVVATVDLKSIISSDVLQPAMIRAAWTYELQETIGYPTAAATLAGRYLVAVRNAWWVFVGNPDVTSIDVIPIRRERILKGVGCIGSKACDALDDMLYFIGEDGVYAWNIGSESPVEIGGDAMREEIMARGANWVESQSVYNMPLLCIDKRNREVWVYTQKGTIHVYNIQRQAWTVFDFGDGFEIADFYFNMNTRKMYIAVGGHGIARMDWSVSPANDTLNNTATTYAVTKDVVTRPIEMIAPRVDTVVDDIGVFHLATASQTGQSLTAYVSFDRGATYPKNHAVTLLTTAIRNPIHLFQMAPSITLKLSHVGKAGAAIWAVSKADIRARVLAGEWPQARPTTTGATL